MQNTGLMLLLLCVLSGCEQKPIDTTLQCKDLESGQTPAEQTAIADACFRRGSFKKSTLQEW